MPWIWEKKNLQNVDNLNGRIPSSTIFPYTKNLPKVIPPSVQKISLHWMYYWVTPEEWKDTLKKFLQKKRKNKLSPDWYLQYA